MYTIDSSVRTRFAFVSDSGRITISIGLLSARPLPAPSASLMASAILVALLLLTNGAAQSEPAAPSDEPAQTQIEEITVTAQRRSENSQTVPISVSAVTAQDLMDRGISSTVDLAATIPGLTMQQDSDYGYINLRGVGSNAVVPGYDNAVAVYMDGVYVGSQSGWLFSLNNISQVEVLKGPQGTLFAAMPPVASSTL